jgi:hypothetical protein
MERAKFSFYVSVSKMITLFTILGIHFGGMLLFALWDAYIGFGVEFDGGTWPPMLLALGFWPITLAATIIAGVSRSLQSVKDQRVKKRETQKRLRIAAEKEQEVLLAQIEREMQEDEDLTVSRGRQSRTTRT